MFNQKIRWDRKLASDNTYGLGTSISVSCIINNGKITPQSFTYENQTIPIDKINFFWKDKNGSKNFFYFSVKTKNGTYQILFNENDFSWHLNKLLSP